MGLVRLYTSAVFEVMTRGGYKFPVRISINVPDFDFLGLLLTVMGMLAIPLAFAIGLGLSLFLIYLIYRKTKKIAQSTG